MSDRILTAIGLLSDAIHAAKVDDALGLASVLAQLETLFRQWRQEVEKRA